MLTKTRGIKKLQLPSSMIKAPKSRTCNDNWLAVVVKNVFPSQENKQMERLLDPDAQPARKSWKEQDRKQLSPMYARMLIGFGVKKRVVDTYRRRSRNAKSLKHGTNFDSIAFTCVLTNGSNLTFCCCYIAHLKGIIDPTGHIPEDKVFIPGYIMDNDKNRELFGKVHKKIFLSRSPALEPTDAKLVSVIGSKPKDMCKADWDLLCSYGFGTIIFPRLKSKLSAPLACMIADGDLDGDDYCVLWDEEILESLLTNKDKLTRKSRKLLHTLKLPQGEKYSVNKATKFAQSPDTKWLSKAQNLML